MIGHNVDSPPELTKYLTLLNWQKPGWQLNGPMTRVGCHMTTSNVGLGGGITEGPIYLEGTKLASLEHHVMTMESQASLNQALGGWCRWMVERL